MKAVSFFILGLCAWTAEVEANEASTASSEAALEYMRMLIPEGSTGDCSVTDVSKTTVGGNGAFKVSCAGQSRTFVLWDTELAEVKGEKDQEISPARATFSDPNCYGSLMSRIAALTERLHGTEVSCRLNPFVVPFPINMRGPGLNEVQVKCKAQGLFGRQLEIYNLTVQLGDDNLCRIHTLYSFGGF